MITLNSIEAAEVSAQTDFAPRVFASRLSSWVRKSNRRPWGPGPDKLHGRNRSSSSRDMKALLWARRSGNLYREFVDAILKLLGAVWLVAFEQGFRAAQSCTHNARRARCPVIWCCPFEP